MAEPRFNSAAVVLGMHRSGTSALAGVLALAGFSAPKTLLPSSAVNERGFWESTPVKALNDSFFAELGTTWHALDSIDFTKLATGQLASMRTRVEEVVLGQFNAGASPLIKDPRLCRLLPMWMPTLTDLSDRVVYPIIIRNPVEVAESLSLRNDFDADLSYLLWARYYLDAEIHTRGLPRCCLSYERLLDDWRASLETICDALGKAQSEALVDKQIDEFVSAELRHHRAPGENLVAELGRWPIVHDAYCVLLSWVEGGQPSNGDFRTLDKARAHFDEFSGPISQLVEKGRLDRKRLANARSQKEDVSAELAKARKALDDRKRVYSLLKAQSAAQTALQARVQSAVESLGNAIRERAKLESRVSDMSAEAARERAALHKLLADAAAAARAERGKLEKSLRNATAARDKLAQDLKRIRADSVLLAKQKERERSAAEHEFQTRLAALQSEQKGSETELKDVKRKYRSTQHQLEREREKLRRTSEQLTEVEKRLAALCQSRVWRSYTAVNALIGWIVVFIKRVASPHARKRRVEGLTLLRNSPLFDAEWYLNRYPDVRAAAIDPGVHYLESGWREGRDPSPSFSSGSYLRSNADVARAGLNPLLHYIEFGRSEGRKIADSSRAAITAPVVPDPAFGPAAACASFPLRDRPPIRWRRAARLNNSENDLIVIGEQGIGFPGSFQERSEIEAAFHRLATLSGYPSVKRDPPQDCTGVITSECALTDAWYVNATRLRSRWRTESGPVVVRGYQRDPAQDGILTLVGEGLAVDAIDFIDFNLANAFFPLLCVFSDPDGTARSAELLAFPSLSRGGAHYAELLAIECATDPGCPFDIIAVSDMLAERVARVINGDRRPFIAKIAIHLPGADGSEPLFQNDFRDWLSNVMRIDVEPLQGASRNAGDAYLATAARLSTKGRKSGATMILSGDMVPSISALARAADSAELPSPEIVLPLVIADSDPAQPATLIAMPPVDAQALTPAANDWAPAWPRLAAGHKCAPDEPLQLAAVRHPKRSLPTDSELLLPIAPPALELRQVEQPITWLIFPEDWDDEVLAQALQALAIQEAGSATVIALIGEGASAAEALAKLLFPERCLMSADVTTGLGSVKTPLVGYLGPNVVLHDRRTSLVLSGMLEDASVVSASCVLVSAEKRGKAWHMAVADPGLFAGVNGAADQLPRHCDEARLFWRSTYPALRPPRDLWLAKSVAVRGWLERAGPLRAHEGIQACTSLVTASYGGNRTANPAHVRPPASAEGQAIRSEALFG